MSVHYLAEFIKPGAASRLSGLLRSMVLRPGLASQVRNARARPLRASPKATVHTRSIFARAHPPSSCLVPDSP